MLNKNLAEQAQAIYCDMFISNARPSWQLGHLSDLITVRYGKDHKKLADGAYPVYGSGGIMRYVEKPLYDKESVLIPRKGTLNNVMYVNEPFWSVDTMFFTEMKLPNVAKFVFHFVKSKDLASLNAGSAVPSMTTDILNAMELYVPDADTLTKFEGIIVCMHDSLDDTIQVKRGFYDNYNGQYVQKDVLIVDYLKGTGMEKFKQFITTVATDRLKCGFQMPEVAITKDAIDFIEK